MICLLLIMTIIFINSTESVEPKIRHPDTLLQEEDMTAKTKIWLLMVESGKIDEEEVRRITPKSIFIAPLLTSRTGKCKEGYRLDHLGQCVKVIKIDPKAQLELLLQRLNKLYGEKKEENEEVEEEKKEAEASNGPLHFSLPISIFNGKTEKENNETKLDISKEDLKPTDNLNDTKTTPEFIPVPSAMIYENHTTEIKDVESSGAEPLNVTEPIETVDFEGSGEEVVGSGDGFLEGKSTTSLPVSILSEETDYLDISETESATVENSQYTETPPLEELPSTKSDILKEVPSSESYQSNTDTPSVNDISGVSAKENTHVQKEIIVKNNSESDKIIFPSDTDYGRDEELRTPTKSSPESSRIRFPDDMSQSSTPRHLLFPDFNSEINRHHTHSGAIPREQFWWLPKNWKIDENHQNSPLVKVWSRLPLVHDVSYSRETPEGLKKFGYLEQPRPQMFNPQQKPKEFTVGSDGQRPPTRFLKPFRSSRFQDVILTPRQHLRSQR